ncbi:MAG: 30S ribosomal protein S12 methylthiotransferase RimO [Kiritimatiellae bacterium]|nr:30S ribosomal protein S12 methylthiotransferase RimO [Kiritimatiellia bacterium]
MAAGTPRPPRAARPPVVSMVSLGCPKNTVDTERILAQLAQAGFWIAERPEDSDLCLVNTCGFIAPAREETATVLRELAALRRRGRPRRLVAIGCLVERAASAPAFARFLEAADAVAGFDVYPRLVSFCRQLLGLADGVGPATGLSESGLAPPRLLTGRPHTTWLKIAEGCSHRCSFCAIPTIRGPQVSRPLESVIAEARELVACGVREICLIAQDTTAYGLERPGLPRLADLIRGLAAVEGDVWLRLMYAHPAHLNEAVMEAMAEDPRWCRYFDLPLQHIADQQLRAMRRPGRAATEALLQRIRDRWPDVAIRTAFIVGHPGETEAQFEELCDFVREARFAHVGVFTYSEEPGTASAALQPKVPAAVAAARRERLMAIQREVSCSCLRAWVGRELEVLVDAPTPAGRRKGAVGRHRGQAPDVDGVVYLRGAAAAGLRPGQVLRARVSAAFEYDLAAEPVGPQAT